MTVGLSVCLFALKLLALIKSKCPAEMGKWEKWKCFFSAGSTSFELVCFFYSVPNTWIDVVCSEGDSAKHSMKLSLIFMAMFTRLQLLLKCMSVPSIKIGFSAACCRSTVDRSHYFTTGSVCYFCCFSCCSCSLWLIDIRKERQKRGGKRHFFRTCWPAAAAAAASVGQIESKDRVAVVANFAHTFWPLFVFQW